MQTDLLERHIPRLLDELADERRPGLLPRPLLADRSHAPAACLDHPRKVAPDARVRPTTRGRAAAVARLRSPSVAHRSDRGRPGAGGDATEAAAPVRSGRERSRRHVTRRRHLHRRYPDGGATAIVTGPEIDTDPVWSQDGTTVLFRRASLDQPDADFLMIARANGSGVKQLTPEPMTGLTASKVSSTWAPKLNYALSPDGRTVALISTIDGIPALFVGDTDGGPIARADAGAIPLSFAFDPKGQDILFVGAQGFDGSYAGLYLIGVDGMNRRTLVEPTLDAQVHSRVAWSPDGSRIAYARFEPGTVDGDRSRRGRSEGPANPHPDPGGHGRRRRSARRTDRGGRRRRPGRPTATASSSRAPSGRPTGRSSSTSTGTHRPWCRRSGH